MTSDNVNAEKTKLNATEPWSPTGNKPFVAIRLKAPVHLTSIKIQGEDNGNGVRAFAVKVKPVGEAGAIYLKDDDGDPKVNLEGSIVSSFFVLEMNVVRCLPSAYFNEIFLRKLYSENIISVYVKF